MAGASGNVHAGRAFVELSLDQSKLERGLKAAQSKLKNFGTAVTSAGKNLLLVAGAAAAPLAMATKVFAGFDDEMRMVKAVTGATEKQFRSLTETAEKLGRETSFTAKEVASGMTALGRMGFHSDEIEKAIPSVLNLARATGTELSEAAGIAANNMRVFRLNASDMTKVSDVLTATANGSAQTLTDLAEGLKMAGPQAAAAGDSFTNVSAALGVLANMGIRGSLAGTALRKAYSQFAKTDVQNQLNAIGIATVDANGNLRAMPDIMTDIARAMNSMPTAERLRFAESIFDLRGSLAGLQLGGNIQQLEDFINKLKSVNSVAAKTASEMDSGIGGSFRILMSALEGVQILLGRIVSEAISPYVKQLTVALQKVAEWCKAHKQLVVAIVKGIAVVAAIGVALVALGVVIQTVAFAVGTLGTLFTVLKTLILAPVVAIKGLMAAFALLKAVMIGVKIVALAMWAAITSPAFLVGAALGAVVALVWKLTGAWDVCADATREVGNDFKTAFAGIAEIFKETWEVLKIALSSGDLAGAAKVGLAALKVAWLTGIYPLKKAWADFKYFLNDAWTVTVYGILKLGNNLWYGLLYGLKSIGNAIADAWFILWKGIVDGFEWTILQIKKGWIKTKGIFQSDKEVEAALAAADNEYAERKDAREREYRDGVARREAEKRDIDDDWNRSNAGIEGAMQDEMNRNRQQRDSAVHGAEDEIRQAEKEWRDAMEAVKAKALEKSKATEVVVEHADIASEKTEQAMQRQSSGVTGDKAVGSWSIASLDGMLGTSSAQERTATATEQIAKESKETKKLLKTMSSSGGMAYI